MQRPSTVGRSYVIFSHRSLRNDLTFSVGVVLLLIPTIITIAASCPKVRKKHAEEHSHAII